MYSHTTQIKCRENTNKFPNITGNTIQVESVKTTSMEDVSTRVLEKIKNI